jgi:Insertion element 4 transposase N-terminal/Transposase DDE domain
VNVAGGRFAAGHVGELTRIVPFEMVDAALAETGTTQRRVRDLPSRVVVYLLLAAALFADLGYSQVWTRMVTGLELGADARVRPPSPSALCQARRRIGAAPLRALFNLLRGPGAGPRTPGTRWRGLLVCAVDGTQMCLPDSAANLAVYRRGGSYHGGTGYPMLRLVTLVCCGTRTVIDAVFGSERRTETAMVAELTEAMRPGMIVLADRNYGYAPTINALAAGGAEVLVRVRNNHRYRIIQRLDDGSFLSRIGQLDVRIVRVQITTKTSAGQRTEVYQLVSTICDPACPAIELARLYHQRWEIETSYFELKSTILGGRVLRARTPQGVEQELYALLIAYQALRITITDALGEQPELDPDRASFTIALNTARAQLTAAAGVLGPPGDLVGVIGRRLLDALLGPRRARTSPRVVKRAISNYTVKTSQNRVRGPSRRYLTEINTIYPDDPLDRGTTRLTERSWG